jgi:hypothetical protein
LIFLFLFPSREKERLNSSFISTGAGGKIIIAFPGKNEKSCFHDTITPVSTSV